VNSNPESPTVKILIKNRIVVTGLTTEASRAIKKSLTIANPLYYRLLRMGNARALYKVPEFFTYYDEVKPFLFIGRGNQDRLIRYLERHEHAYEISDDTCKAQLSTPLSGTITYRPYQEGDVARISEHARGVIRLGTGYGKTVIACGLVQHLNLRTLIIVPRLHLLDQVKKEFKKWFKYDVGVINGTTFKPKDITVATIQTLTRRKDEISSIADTFGMVIVDECHGSITDKQLDVISWFNPSRLYGMTATPRRTDKQGDAIFMTFGDVIIDKDLERATPTVVLVDSNVHIMMQEYADMINEQVENVERNQLIINCITNELQANRKILVLTKRVAHYKLLANVLQRISHERNRIRVHEISSEVNAKDRSALLESLRKGDNTFDVILGTYSMLATGTDIPALDTLIFAGDLRSDVLQEQSAGRILRLFGDKQHPRIIDIVDNGNKILLNQARERIRFYRKMKWL
jgi:superfamily II DNA or RNA helicase